MVFESVHCQAVLLPRCCARCPSVYAPATVLCEDAKKGHRTVNTSSGTLDLALGFDTAVRALGYGKTWPTGQTCLSEFRRFGQAWDGNRFGQRRRRGLEGIASFTCPPFRSGSQFASRLCNVTCAATPPLLYSLTSVYALRSSLPNRSNRLLQRAPSAKAVILTMAALSRPSSQALGRARLACPRAPAPLAAGPVARCPNLLTLPTQDCALKGW